MWVRRPRCPRRLTHHEGLLCPFFAGAQRPLSGGREIKSFCQVATVCILPGRGMYLLYCASQSIAEFEARRLMIHDTSGLRYEYGGWPYCNPLLDPSTTLYNSLVSFESDVPEYVCSLVLTSRQAGRWWRRRPRHQGHGGNDCALPSSRDGAPAARRH